MCGVYICYAKLIGEGLQIIASNLDSMVSQMSSETILARNAGSKYTVGIH